MGAGNERPQAAWSGKLFSVISLIWEQAAQLQGQACYSRQLPALLPPPPQCPHSTSGPGASAAPSRKHQATAQREACPDTPLSRCATHVTPQPGLAYRGAAASSHPPGPPHLQVMVQAEPCPGLPLLQIRSIQARS